MFPPGIAEGTRCRRYTPGCSCQRFHTETRSSRHRCTWWRSSRYPGTRKNTSRQRKRRCCLPRWHCRCGKSNGPGRSRCMPERHRKRNRRTGLPSTRDKPRSRNPGCSTPRHLPPRSRPNTPPRRCCSPDTPNPHSDHFPCTHRRHHRDPCTAPAHRHQYRRRWRPIRRRRDSRRRDSRHPLPMRRTDKDNPRWPGTPTRSRPQYPAPTSSAVFRSSASSHQLCPSSANLP